MPRLTHQDVLDRQARQARYLRRINALRMRAVAASLPQQRVPAPQGALTSREAASPARETASTTTTRDGGPSGCSSQSR